MLGNINKSLKYEYRLFLCKPDNVSNPTMIGEIKPSEIIYNPKLLDISELNFSVLYYDDEFLTKNNTYDLIRENYLIKLNINNQDIGYFIIRKVLETQGDIISKNIVCQSYEFELCLKKIRSFKGTKRLYSSTNTNEIIINNIPYADGKVNFLVNNNNVEVSLLSSDSLNDVATKVASAIDALSNYSAVATDNSVVVTSTLSSLLDITFYDTNKTLVEIIINGHGVLNYVLSLLPSWSIGTIDTTVSSENKYRTFDVSEQYIYDFLKEDVAQAFRCVFIYDILDKKINVNRIDNLNTNKGLIIGDYNFIKELSKEINMDDIVTKMLVYGKGIGINSVNPTGRSYVENYSYFMYTHWMSQDLINALNNYYNVLLPANETVFQGYLTTLDTYNSQLITKQNELSVLQSELDILNSNRNVLMKLGASGFIASATSSTATLESTASSVDDEYNGKTISIISGTGSGQSKTILSYDGTTKVATLSSNWSTIPDKTSKYTFIYDLFNQIASKEAEITAKKNEITALNNNINSVYSNIDTLKNTLSKENNFTSNQLKQLDRFVYEGTYQNNNFDKYMIQDLYDDSKIHIAKINKPTVSFKISILDFLSVVEFQHSWDKLVLGDIINIISEELGINIQVRLNGYTHNALNNELQLDFSTYNKPETTEEKIKDILKDSIKAGTTNDIERNQYKQYESDKEFLDNFINDSVDTSRNPIVAGQNGNIKIDKFEILLSDIVSSPGKLKILDNTIIFSEDDFLTCGVAISPKGIVAKYLFGEVVAGNNLKITNDAGSFIVDGNGMTATDMSLTLTTTAVKDKIILDPTNGFKIQKNTGTTPSPIWSDIFSLDSSSGEIEMNLTKSDNKFRMKFNTTDGILFERGDGVGNWTNSIFSVDSNGNIVVNDITANNITAIGIFKTDTGLSAGHYERMVVDGNGIKSYNGSNQLSGLVIEKTTSSQFSDLKLYWQGSEYFTVYNNIGSLSLKSQGVTFLVSSGVSSTAEGSWRFTGNIAFFNGTPASKTSVSTLGSQTASGGADTVDISSINTALSNITSKLNGLINAIHSYNLV